MDTVTLVVITLMIVAIPIALLFNRLTQSVDDYKEKIIDELKCKGFELIDIRIPKLLETGPFPIFRIRFIQTRVIGVSGEKVRYRKVKYKDNKGLVKMSWIRIQTTAFVINEIKWIPEL